MQQKAVAARSMSEFARARLVSQVCGLQHHNTVTIYMHVWLLGNVLFQPRGVHGELHDFWCIFPSYELAGYAVTRE